MNKRQKTNLYFLIPFLIFAIIYMYWAKEFTRKQDGEAYKHFYRTNIYGKIKHINGVHRGYSFRVESLKDLFFFFPDVNVNHRFKHTQVGDSICKPAYSDTLWVKNKGEWHPYTFSKYEE